MRVIDQQPGIEALRQRGQIRQGREIAVHREHAFGGEERVAMPMAMRRQQFLGVSPNRCGGRAGACRG